VKSRGAKFAALQLVIVRDRRSREPNDLDWLKPLHHPPPSYPSQIGVELSDGHPKSFQIGVGFSDWDSIGVGLTRFQFRAMSCDDAIQAIRRALRAHPPSWLSTRIQRTLIDDIPSHPSFACEPGLRFSAKG
jgi:hypothetical protein